MRCSKIAEAEASACVVTVPRRAEQGVWGTSFHGLSTMDDFELGGVQLPCVQPQC